MTKQSKTFNPDWVSPPGDTIRDLITERGWGLGEAAEKLDYSIKYLNQLLKSQVPITTTTAIKLAQVLGSTDSFWLNREAKHHEYTKKLWVEYRAKTEAEKTEYLAEQKAKMDTNKEYAEEINDDRVT